LNYVYQLISIRAPPTLMPSALGRCSYIFHSYPAFAAISIRSATNRLAIPRDDGPIRHTVERCRMRGFGWSIGWGKRGLFSCVSIVSNYHHYWCLEEIDMR
jgi:hypothetical protein